MSGSLAADLLLAMLDVLHSWTWTIYTVDRVAVLSGQCQLIELAYAQAPQGSTGMGEASPFPHRASASNR
jgi:hypothetical protein